MRLILGRDSALVSELITTTESSTPSGGKVYHPQKRDEEHTTDSLRALVLAIRDLERDTDTDPSYLGGWVEFGGVGTTRDYQDYQTAGRAPWNLS